MKHLLMTLTLLALAFTPAKAQIQQQPLYAPFPADFETLDAAKKEQVLRTVETNTEQYFHSRAYGEAINKFAREQNSANIKSCEKLSMNQDKTKNKITIINPLLFAQADDLHPLVGAWEQTASFTGCGKLFEFTMSATANKGEAPVLTVKR